MNDKKTVKIFVASSFELKEEREKCVLLVNQLNTCYKHLYLKPIEWEFEMVYGSFPGYKNIQDAINPKLQDSDIAVFLFYSKIGPYTRQEFELANREGKKIIPFFKTGFSAKGSLSNQSFTELLLFKESYEGVILPIDFVDINDFQGKFYTHLNQFLSENYRDSYIEKLQELNNQRSDNLSILLKELAEKNKKIQELEDENKKLPILNEEQIKELKTERDNLQDKLSQNKEVQEQQARDKILLEYLLSLQREQDELKAKALEEVKKGNYRVAENYLIESAKDSIQVTASTFYELGKIKKLQLKYKEALEYYQLAIKIDSEVGLYLNEAGVISIDLGFYEEGEIFFTKALFIYKEKFGEEHFTIASLYNNIGIVNYIRADYEEAIKFYNEALKIDINTSAVNSPEIAVRYNRPLA